MTIHGNSLLVHSANVNKTTLSKNHSETLSAGNINTMILR